jgi:hypothetical protein
MLTSTPIPLVFNQIEHDPVIAVEGIAHGHSRPFADGSRVDPVSDSAHLNFCSFTGGESLSEG